MTIKTAQDRLGHGASSGHNFVRNRGALLEYAGESDFLSISSALTYYDKTVISMAIIFTMKQDLKLVGNQYQNASLICEFAACRAKTIGKWLMFPQSMSDTY